MWWFVTAWWLSGLLAWWLFVRYDYKRLDSKVIIRLIPSLLTGTILLIVIVSDYIGKRIANMSNKVYKTWE